MSARNRRLIVTLIVYASFVGGSLLLNVLPGKASDDDHDQDSRVARGFALVSGLKLNLKGKDRGLVGLGAYLVNGVGGCNDCHTNPPYPAGGDPTMGQPKKINVAAYLAGGMEFIPASPGFHAIVSRNLTPDKTGKPEGGASFQEFRSIMRTGVDPDHAHPEYGPFLIVMPWPVYQGMIDHDLRAVYEFLSTIPCIEGDPGLPNPRPIGTRCQ
jgi:hypothetical protein